MMTDSEKPEIDLTDADGITVDDDGNPRVEMESLQKGGSEDIEGLYQAADH